MQVIRKAKYKVNSRYDGYWYIVFVELTDELKNKLDIRFGEKVDYWVIADDKYVNIGAKYCWENWVRRVDDGIIEKWLE